MLRMFLNVIQSNSIMKPELRYDLLSILLVSPWFIPFIVVGIIAYVQNNVACLAICGIFLIIGILTYLYGRKKPQRKSLVERWEQMKKDMVNVKPEFEMVKGEKIIVPLSPAYIRSFGLATLKYSARDLVVTNKRILIGFSNVIGFKETFGEMNFWHPETTEIPKVKSEMGFLNDPLGGNTKINTIFLSKNGESVKIILYWGPLPFLFEIYHPQAKKIYEIFSTKNA